MKNRIETKLSQADTNYVQVLSLTIHAAWTASERCPASGSHQNTWHSNRCVPPSTMTAKVWLSWPTPRKVRKRTWQSQKGSSPSCQDPIRWIKQWVVVTSDLMFEHRSNDFDVTSPFQRDRMLSVTWMTIGSHSSLSVEFMMLSIARFNTSIPVTQTHQQFQVTILLILVDLVDHHLPKKRSLGTCLRHDLNYMSAFYGWVTIHSAECCHVQV